LIRDDEPAVRAVSDLFGPNPFGLERRGRGYLIRSASNDDGKPKVSLEIGDAAWRLASTGNDRHHRPSAFVAAPFTLPIQQPD
jgi:hypothetical protein